MTEDLWKDMLIAYMLCACCTTYFYSAQSSRCLQMLGTCLPAVSFFVGKEYGAWLMTDMTERPESFMANWHSWLIPISVCVAYSGAIACAVLYAQHRRLEEQTAVANMLENMLESGDDVFHGSTRDTDIEAVHTQNMPVTGVLYDIVRREPPVPPLLGNMSTVGDDTPNLHIRSSPDSRNMNSDDSDATQESLALPRPTAPALQSVV
tara:strand:- start:167 stop:787 length:621 start_codon:yes stop_codon:yes gene_type:complete